VKQAPEYPVFGNGDIFSWQEAKEFRDMSGVAGVMLARGALVKPWLFKEIKEER
jgi:tRNA-dihydrouridine synthase 3